MAQDPAMIQHEIEQTRAELAEAIDAIADIVSPKRVAERARAQIETKVAEIRQKVLPAHESPLALEPGVVGGTAEEPPALPAGEGEGDVVVRRTVRWDRVVLVSGTLMLLVVAGGRRRRHRRRTARRRRA
jgi:hypothetical protein